MRALLSLLLVVLVAYMLSRILIGSNSSVSYNQPGSQSGVSRSEAVRERLDDSTEQYQQKLEQSLENAGTGQ